jgi:hypothetical protein
MISNPIVHEVRLLREQHAASFNYDLKAIFADLKRTEGQRQSTLLQPPEEMPPNNALQRTRHARLRRASVARR